MKIEKIQLNNFRGFKGEHIIDFDPNLNVFVGRNGAGKSSILDAVGMLLKNLTQDCFLIYHPASGIYSVFDLSDINIDTKSAALETHIRGFYNYSNEISEELFNEINVRMIAGDSDSNRGIRPLNIRHKINNAITDNTNLPIIRHFKFSPALTQKKENYYKYNQLKAYKNAFASNTDFETFTEWFIEEENEENRKKVKTRNLDYINPKLNPVRIAIEHFFIHFPDSAFSNLSSEEEQKNGHLSPLTISKNNQNINLTQLSDGEKQIILYVADVASRLAIANPSLEDTNQGYGVVLIDEIEAHLHPEWQRNIIPALRGTFPNIQFFVTTHSPQVISNVEHQHIKIIENFKLVENTPHTYGRDANNILYNIFGVEERLPQIQTKFNELYDLIDDENTNGEAKKLMQEIKTMLGEDDPEVQRAATYLEFNA